MLGQFRDVLKKSTSLTDQGLLKNIEAKGEDTIRVTASTLSHLLFTKHSVHSHSNTSTEETAGSPHSQGLSLKAHLPM